MAIKVWIKKRVIKPNMALEDSNLRSISWWFNYLDAQIVPDVWIFVETIFLCTVHGGTRIKHVAFGRLAKAA